MNNKSIILEVGLNHLGKTLSAEKYLNFFLNSNYDKITFQINTSKFYKKYPYELPLSFYRNALKKVKLKKKKIGLAVCDLETLARLKELNFDFYKLLAIGINNKELINFLKKKRKEVYISLGVATNAQIKKCIRLFENKLKLKLIYTNLSYDPRDLNMKSINQLKEKYNLQVGYGHHYKNELPIFISKILNYNFIFLYIKSKSISRSGKLPDDLHAIDIKDLEQINLKLDEIDKMLKNYKINKKIKIFD